MEEVVHATMDDAYLERYPTERTHVVKAGFHYPSWRPEVTARVDGWPVSITPNLPVNTGRVDG